MLQQERKFGMSYRDKIRCQYIDLILVEEALLKDIKSIYAKYAFTHVGHVLKEAYNHQADIVKKRKNEYKERYGS